MLWLLVLFLVCLEVYMPIVPTLFQKKRYKPEKFTLAYSIDAIKGKHILNFVSYNVGLYDAIKKGHTLLFFWIQWIGFSVCDKVMQRFIILYVLLYSKETLYHGHLVSEYIEAIKGNRIIRVRLGRMSKSFVYTVIVPCKYTG